MANNKNDRNIYVENDIIYGIIGCIAGALVARVWGVIIAIVITCYFIYKHLELQAKQEYYRDHPGMVPGGKQVEYITKEQARDEAIAWASMMLKDSKRVAGCTLETKTNGMIYIYTHGSDPIIFSMNYWYHITTDINSTYIQDNCEFLNHVLKIAKDFDKTYFLTFEHMHDNEEYWLIKTKSGQFYLISSKGFFDKNGEGLTEIINKKYGTNFIADDADNRAKGAVESL